MKCRGSDQPAGIEIAQFVISRAKNNQTEFNISLFCATQYKKFCSESDQHSSQLWMAIERLADN